MSQFGGTICPITNSNQCQIEVNSLPSTSSFDPQGDVRFYNVDTTSCQADFVVEEEYDRVYVTGYVVALNTTSFCGCVRDMSTRTETVFTVSFTGGLPAIVGNYCQLLQLPPH